MARGIGIALLVLGLLGLAWGGFSWKEKENVDLGPVDFSVTERKTVPIPPLLGAAAIVAGLALVVVGGARRRET
jgi:hypothetical protein